MDNGYDEAHKMWVDFIPNLVKILSRCFLQIPDIGTDFTLARAVCDRTITLLQEEDRVPAGAKFATVEAISLWLGAGWLLKEYKEEPDDGLLRVAIYAALNHAANSLHKAKAELDKRDASQ